MSKRRLTRKQQQRIQKQQEARLLTSGDAAAELDLSLGPALSGLVICNFGQQLEVECLDGERRGESVRCHQRSNMPPLVCGDRVVWQADGDQTGVVVALEKRRNVFSRPGFGNELKPLAANIDRVLIVLAPSPPPHRNLLDRYLVAVETLSMQPVIVLNKMDLLADDQGYVDSMLSLYEAIGYQVIRVSAHSGAGIPDLQASLLGTTAVVVGQSGVGKSSLINALDPGLAAAVGELSHAMEKGTHTTTSARLFHADGYDLIDSPGIREFSLWHVSRDELLHGFREFRPWLGQCRFRDCSHRQEPQCALREAVADGRIDPQRLDSYFQILQTLGNDS
ncbi:MAG: hypothetical protein RLZZ385_943 [Pseudomonadota bacterium]